MFQDQLFELNQSGRLMLAYVVLMNENLLFRKPDLIQYSSQVQVCSSILISFLHPKSPHTSIILMSQYGLPVSLQTYRNLNIRWNALEMTTMMVKVLLWWSVAFGELRCEWVNSSDSFELWYHGFQQQLMVEVWQAGQPIKYEILPFLQNFLGFERNVTLKTYLSKLQNTKLQDVHVPMKILIFLGFK